MGKNPSPTGKPEIRSIWDGYGIKKKKFHRYGTGMGLKRKNFTGMGRVWDGYGIR
ncbi:hypothetical protein HanRHA438_Chr09g0400841 [Helianthus annuus]|nr:hypothetical protein HanRHA438_Chr09g0400841 [Helianthus annuus]